jgi:hypothetical protein
MTWIIWALQLAGEAVVGLLVLGMAWFIVLCVAEWISERGN